MIRDLARKREKLVRDRIPEIIKASGRGPVVKRLTGKALTAALVEKLTEELAGLLSASGREQMLDEVARRSRRPDRGRSGSCPAARRNRG